MSRFAPIVLCTAALVLCLVALPLVSTGQEVTTDSQGRSVTAAPGRAGGPSTSVVEPDSAIPEGTVTIYSNFGSGYSYDCCLGWAESGSSLATSEYGYWIGAMAFTPTKGTYLLTQIDLAMTWVIGTNGIKLELRADDEGKPGRTINSWEVTGLPTFTSTSNTVKTIKVHAPIILLSGQQYWLVPIANSDEDAVWNDNSLSPTAAGREAYSIDGGVTWTVRVINPNGAFDVLGLNLLACLEQP